MTKPRTFVSYLRVSTGRQGLSGLGLEAQRSAVRAHLDGQNWTIVAEVVEVETGTRSDRPQLIKAMRLCRLHGATLLVAKLDRLSRNVAFLSKLMEEGVRFVAADIPSADTTHLHMMVTFAQHEVKVIKARTKAALAQAKLRGQKLGGRRVSPERFAKIATIGRAVSTQVRTLRALKRAEDLLPIIQDIKDGGATSLRQIADELNKQGIKAPRGGEWTAVQVGRVGAKSCSA